MSRKRYGMFDVDVESIVRSQDLVYEDAGTTWADGHILGNGDMGVVAYVPHWFEWTINKIDVFDGRVAPKKRLRYKQVLAEAKKRGTNRTDFLSELEVSDFSNSPPEPLLKSCGQVKIRSLSNEYSWGAPPLWKTRQVLSLWEATDSMEATVLAGHNVPEPACPRIKSFVSRESNLLVIRLRDAAPPLLRKRLELCRPYDYDLEMPNFGAAGNMIWFTQKMPDGSSYAMAMGAVALDSRYCRRARLKPGITGVEQIGDRIWLLLTGDFDLFVGAATSYESSNPLALAKRIVRTGIRKGADRLQKDHARWWADFWKKSFIQFDAEPMLEQLWYFGLYEMGCSFGRAPVPGIFGLWYGHHDMPVQGFFWAVYTLNKNIQSHTLPVFCVNHPEMAVPFMDTFLNALPRTIEETKARFGLPGARFSTEMAFLGGEPPVPSAFCLYGAGGPYCGMIFEWAYRYTQDKKLLKKKIYPFLHEVVRFLVAFMEKGDDGLYHFQPIVPEEYNILTRDALDCVALLKPCLKLAIEASEMFGLDEEERKGWKDVWAHYPAYPVKDGALALGTDIPPGTTVWPWVLQVLPVFLAHEEDEEVWRLVKKAFDARVIPDRLYCGNTCWHVGMTMLRYQMKKEILPLVNRMIHNLLKPNGLMSHLSMAGASENAEYRETVSGTPENNAAFVMLVTETLMQSYNGLIRLFPGMTGKASARLGDLLAEGAFLVSSELKCGKVKFVSIKAEKAGTARVKNPWSGKVVNVVRSRGGKERVKGRVLSVSLRRGESVTFVPAGERAAVKRVVSKRPACPKVKTSPDGSVVRLGKRE